MLILVHKRSLRPLRLLVVLLLAITFSMPSARAQDEPDPELFDPSVLRDFDLDFESADWEQRLAALGEGEDLPADLSVEGETYEGIGARYKGGSSSRVQGRKKPFNLTIDHQVQGQDLMGYDVLNLNNGFVDPTLVREVITARRLGLHMPMIQTAHARLLVEGEYFGLYILVEQIEGTFLRSWFRNNDGILFKGDAPDGAEGGGGGGGRPPRPLALPSFDMDTHAGRGLDFGPSRDARPVRSLNGDARPVADRNSSPRHGIAGIHQGPGGFRSALTWEGEDLAAYRSAYDLKTEEAGDAAYEALRELTRVLDAPESEGGVSDADFPAAIREQLDVDGALWYLAGINLFTNYDSYLAGHNYYLYQAEEDGRFHILAWDLNESFGVFPGAGISPDDPMAVARTDPFLMAEGAQAAQRPLLRRLLAVPAFRADYLAHYRTLLDSSFEPAGLRASIDAAQDLIREAVGADPNRLYGFDLFEQNVETSVRVGNRAVPGLMEVADARVEYLRGRADLAVPDLDLASRLQEPEVPLEGDEVSIQLEFEGADPLGAVELVYTFDGDKPVRLVMDEEDGRYRATLPAAGRNDDITYYARVALVDGRSAFFPASNQLSPWAYEVRGRQLPVEPGGDLVLNELLADNETTLADPAGEFDDWVEIVNRGAEALSLAGYHLSDDPEDPLAYALPDLLLAPGERYLVWCDNDEEQGPDHAGFRLSKDGETLLLSTAEKTVDLLTYPPQETDRSWARWPDGEGDWRDCAPSPRAVNACDGVAPTVQPSRTATPTPTEGSAATRTPATTEGLRVFLPRLERP